MTWWLSSAGLLTCSKALSAGSLPSRLSPATFCLLETPSRTGILQLRMLSP
jgi:hypothetical protein